MGVGHERTTDKGIVPLILPPGILPEMSSISYKERGGEKIKERTNKAVRDVRKARFFY